MGTNYKDYKFYKNRNEDDYQKFTIQPEVDFGDKEIKLSINFSI